AGAGRGSGRGPGQAAGPAAGSSPTCRARCGNRAMARAPVRSPPSRRWRPRRLEVEAVASTGPGPWRGSRGLATATRWIGPGTRVVLWVSLAVAVVVAAALGWWQRPGPERLQWGEQPFVLVYHTHATEAFLPDLPGGDRPGRDIHRDA